jgi:hypothetical protein
MIARIAKTGHSAGPRRWLASAMLVFGVMVGTSVSPTEARASAENRALECRNFFEILYLNVGLTLAGGFHSPFRGGLPEESGMVLGGEASLVYLGEESPGLFGGIVAEGVYDWSRHGPRAMVGPVFGLWFGGIDGGYVVDFSGGRKRHGGAVRLFGTVGFLSLYVRYGVMHRAPDFMDFGFLVKLPLPVWGR